MELLSDPSQNFVTSLVELCLDELGKKPAEAELQEAEAEGEEAESNYCQNTDDVFICRFSSMDKKVTVGKYRGKPLVSLREWFVTADGTNQATTNGISLDAVQWENLKNNYFPKI
nr:RNA polymerase II transcriptional coactivator KELP [Ipomoea batatas]